MARRELTDKTPWDAQHDYVAYVADALAGAGEDGDTDVAALAAPVAKLVDRWEGLDKEGRQARRAIGRAHARVKRRDRSLDAAATNLHHDILAEVRQSREHPLFQRFYPDGLFEVVKLALESQLPVMRALLLKLREPETPPALRKAHDKAIDQAVELGDAAIKAREAAFADAGRAAARRVSFREDVNRVLLGIEGALQQLASARRLDTAWVDSFFPDSPKKSKSKKNNNGGDEGPGDK